MGVVTGIVQEFVRHELVRVLRFGGHLRRAARHRSPLAFFLESTSACGFGWDRLPKRMHAAMMWLVASGQHLGAVILIANSFMQEPVGYHREGRAQLTSFWALVANPNVWVQWPHVCSPA